MAASLRSRGPVTGAFLQGRLVATYDRASLTVTAHDGRGRSPTTAVRIAKPGTPDNALATRFTERWYQRQTLFDAADREIAATTGATSTELMGTLDPATGSASTVRTAYTQRGTAKHVKGSYGDLVHRIERTVDGLIERIEYGDLAKTTTDFSYDVRRRVKTVQTYRGPPAGWNAPNNQPTFQLLLQDDELIYDSVGNPTEIRDWRIASEWPAGAKPVTKKAQYDDLYRVARVDYQHDGGDDPWTSPFAAENSGQAELQDPRRAEPSPHVDFTKRLAWQTFEYDWLGNTKKTDDDAHGFYARSLGAITNDTYRLTAADNTTSGGSKTGKLETRYDAAGNLTRLQVKRNGTCLPAGADCSQVFAYTWDEVGRLTRARRWDVAALPAITAPLPTATPSAHLRFGYDAGDQRVLKTAVDDTVPTDETAGRHTVYVFESLELRRAAFSAGDYELSKWTETGFLFAHGVRLARVAWDQPDVPTIGGAETHVFLELGDHLGSTSVVLDKATGELVERGTWQAYGGGESDFRPERWKGFREDYGFTGKEEDVEVGLQYFGKRYYAPLLNRWVSADPLAVHEPGEADLNLYAYVSGSPLKNVDPLGLQEKPSVPEPSEVTVKSVQPKAGGGSTIELDPVVVTNTGRVSVPEGPYEVRPPADASPEVRGLADARNDAVRDLHDAVARARDAYDAYQRALDAAEYLKNVTSGQACGGCPNVFGDKGVKRGIESDLRGTRSAAERAGKRVDRAEQAFMSADGKYRAAAAKAQTGSYTNTHASGKTYSGKGSRARSQKSGRRVERETGDQHVATEWTPSKNTTDAFKDEYRRLKQHGGPRSPTNYNKVESPGKKLLKVEE